MAAVSLIFAPGERPDAKAVLSLAQERSGFAVSFDPDTDDGSAANDDGRWLELLVNGLTFDLVGLAPGSSAQVPSPGHHYGLAPGFGDAGLEAITLQPGPHLASGGAMLPVVRSLALLAARMAALPGVAAIAWHPARCWSAPEAFADAVVRWTEGGAFPVFSLAALFASQDGAMQSEGLALFTRQELRIEPELAANRAEAGKLAVRLIHWLAERGTLTGPQPFAGPDGTALRLEPSANGRFVRVRGDDR
ncbi:MAG: hypothetical protein ABIT16_07410 [Croceibacterium sp.]